MKMFGIDEKTVKIEKKKIKIVDPMHLYDYDALMNQKNPDVFNYWYFGGFFLLLLLTSTASILLKDNLAGSRLFFWFYALGQTLFEVSFFSFLAAYIYRLLGRTAFWLFIGATFLLIIFHFLDFMIDRILDLSVWNALTIFVLDESLENFYYLLDASGVPLVIWYVVFAFIALLPMLGMLLFKSSHWFAQKWPLRIKNEVYLQMFVCIPAALLFWDFSASKVVHPDAYTEFVKSLPWKRTFFQPKTVQLPMKNPLRSSKDEQEIETYLETVQRGSEKKPNIYLFIVESLRGDFLDEKTAPHLSHFREENICAKTALSNANGTNVSWFSIFHSEFPFYWQKLQQQQWKMGSPALALFKKLGYKIRVYSSAELHYYGMEDLLFGEKHHLIDSMQMFNHSPPKQAWESDLAALRAMQKDLEDPGLQEGQLIVVFWDGTHFDYSWPKEKVSRFIPFATELAYFKLFQSRLNIELVRNRYRNAIHQIDSLFGEFLKKVPSDAIIAFTGDHGEEFFDHGHLFHCSHLVDAQTCIPLYLKMGGRKERLPMISQMDIMPSLLDAACGIEAPFLEGESVLKLRKWPFTVISRFNASHSPYEFCVHSGTNKLVLQFENKKNIFDCTDLKIMRLSAANDESLIEDKPLLEDWINMKFSPALNRIFPQKNN
jgi:glucan phosphoethanolaminetransferase (alkaline phosphatase superfamily)